MLDGEGEHHICCAAYALTVVKNTAFRKDTPHKAARLAWVRIVHYYPI